MEYLEGKGELTDKIRYKHHDHQPNGLLQKSLDFKVEDKILGETKLFKSSFSICVELCSYKGGLFQRKENFKDIIHHKGGGDFDYEEKILL